MTRIDDSDARQEEKDRTASQPCWPLNRGGHCDLDPGCTRSPMTLAGQRAGPTWLNQVKLDSSMKKMAQEIVRVINESYSMSDSQWEDDESMPWIKEDGLAVLCWTQWPFSLSFFQKHERFCLNKSELLFGPMTSLRLCTGYVLTFLRSCIGRQCV